MNTEEQKKVATAAINLLASYTNDRVYVAGGAARDWFYNKPISDIDIFAHVKKIIPVKDLTAIFKVKVVNLSKDNYKYENNYLLNVSQFKVGEQVVQVMQVDASLSLEKVLASFPLSISQFSYDGKGINVSYLALTSMRNIVRTIPLTDRTMKYENKIKKKYPEFKFWKSTKEFFEHQDKQLVKGMVRE